MVSFHLLCSLVRRNKNQYQEQVEAERLAFSLVSRFPGIYDFPWPVVAFHPGAFFALLLAPISQIRKHGIRELGWCSFSVQDTFEVLLQGCFCWGAAQDGYMPDLLEHEAIGR